MEMTKEACQQEKTPFDLSNDFGPLRHSRTWERKKSKNVGTNLCKKLEMKEKISKNVGTCIRNLRWGGETL